MKRKIALFLLAYIFLFVLGLAFHHHADGASHDDTCAICFHATHHSNLALQDSPRLSQLASVVLAVPPERTADLAGPSWSPYSNRAPPAQAA